MSSSGSPIGVFDHSQSAAGDVELLPVGACSGRRHRACRCRASRARAPRARAGCRRACRPGRSPGGARPRPWPARGRGRAAASAISRLGSTGSSTTTSGDADTPSSRRSRSMSRSGRDRAADLQRLRRRDSAPPRRDSATARSCAGVRDQHVLAAQVQHQRRLLVSRQPSVPSTFKHAVARMHAADDARAAVGLRLHAHVAVDRARCRAPAVRWRSRADAPRRRAPAAARVPARRRSASSLPVGSTMSGENSSIQVSSSVRACTSPDSGA